MPEYLIAMGAFPLTASGKIPKRELVQLTKEGHIQPTPIRWRDPPRRQES
jgi:acyl-CoA synthetase